MVPLIDVSSHDPHEETLVANVRPPGWTNPVPARRYHLVVIGAGTAGLVAAAGAASLGARVALVERARLGGDCLNAGCVPSKGVIRAARAAADVAHASSFGVRVPSGAEPDFPAAMERMRRLRARISAHDAAGRFRDELGVDVFLGAGRFVGPDAVEVDGRRLPFRRAVIATGARPGAPDVPGLDEAGYLTNETVFSLTERPRRLAVIGGGPIGCELAHAFQRLGSKVCLIEVGAQLLPHEDPDAAALVHAALQRDGVDVRLETRPSRVARDGPTRRLHLVRDGSEAPLDADAVLVATGRVPNVEGVGLDAAGVQADTRRGVLVDKRLRTTNRHVYAAGDVCLKTRFTHAADAAARVVIQNALFLGRRKFGTVLVPRCTYTDPELAHVGLTRREAEEQGIAVTSFTRPFEDVDRAVLDGEEDGFVRVHVRRGTDRIVGATIVARHAGEMIGELAVAMHAKVGLGRLAGVIHPYPTQAEAIRQTGDLYLRTRLTPFARRLLGLWLALRA